jgi:hypothetical protein
MRLPLEIVVARSHTSLARPAQAQHLRDLARLSRVRDESTGDLQTPTCSPDESEQHLRVVGSAFRSGRCQCCNSLAVRPPTGAQ